LIRLAGESRPFRRRLHTHTHILPRLLHRRNIKKKTYEIAYKIVNGNTGIKRKRENVDNNNNVSATERARKIDFDAPRTSSIPTGAAGSATSRRAVVVACTNVYRRVVVDVRFSRAPQSYRSPHTRPSTKGRPNETKSTVPLAISPAAVHYPVEWSFRGERGVQTRRTKAPRATRLRPIPSRHRRNRNDHYNRRRNR